MNALTSIVQFFSTRSIKCKCGGIIAEQPAWGDAFYTCNQCAEYATETDFDERYEASRK